MANWNMKRCSALLNIWEPQIKTTMKYHLKPVRMPIIKERDNTHWKECRKREPLYTIGGNVHWYINYGK